jgi:hypothetical protein
MLPLTIVDQGELYRNPLPGHRVINVLFPTAVLLGNGEILCVARVGLAMYSVEGDMELFRSQDGGKTWQREGPPYDRSQDHVQYNYRSADQTVLRDGSLVMKLTRAEHPDPEKLFFNPETGGMLAGEFCYIYSGDGGRTWTDPVAAVYEEPFAAHHVPEHCGPMIELEDGTWFQSIETWKHHGDAGPFDLNTYGMFSRDRGRTWDRRVPVAVGSDNNRSFSHGMPTQLSDGRVLISLWAAESQLQTSHDVHMVRSIDGSCREWTEPKSLGVFAQTTGTADMGNGRMLMIYSHREQTEQPGLKVVLSEDAGDSFDNEDPLIVWDAYGKEALGVARSDTYPSSHDAIAYGAPRIVRLDDQHALAVFWCTQGADTHIRWSKVRVD